PYVTGSSPVRGAIFREARSGKPERAFCFLLFAFCVAWLCAKIDTTHPIVIYLLIFALILFQ
ncbi:hypothetical protein, partial [Serratia ureilytica]|uniref:hypothetical protein n=1 Tax=Serratia ureilytica TaxID=300181 RepID=UPI003FA6DE47